MSVQVGYGKQFVWFLLTILIILTVVEGSVRIYEFIFPDCFYLTSDAGKEMDFEFKKKICEQSKFVKVTDYPVYQFEPNQNLDTININSFGFRGSEIDKNKADNVFRIFVIGGSSTFGYGAT